MINKSQRWLVLVIVLFALLGLTLSIARQPSHIAVRTNYTVYLPMVSRPLGMGLAWGSHRTELNADWCYNAWDAGGCLNSNYDFQHPATPCPTIELLGNEPDGWEGSGYPTEPEVAAGLSRQAREVCPNTVFIAGNTVQGNTVWIDGYLEAGGVADWLGTHCYAPTAQDCIVILTTFREHYLTWPICVTEWNIGSEREGTPLTTRPQEFKSFLDWIKIAFPCSAVYTDYAPPPWDIHNLLNPDGTPNELGRIFAGR